MDLEIEVSQDLISKLNGVAGKLYPSARQEDAVSRIVEQALAMRLFYLHIGDMEALKVEKPVGHWEFPTDTVNPKADVAHWLFNTE